VLSFPFFIWRISLATSDCAFAPYLRVLPERWERVVRESVPVAFGECALIEDEAPAEPVERRLVAALLRERGVEARRALAFPLVREAAERRRLLVLLLPTRVAEALVWRERDVRLLVAMV
jgi:hypothetical protein